MVGGHMTDNNKHAIKKHHNKLYNVHGRTVHRIERRWPYREPLSSPTSLSPAAAKCLGFSGLAAKGGHRFRLNNIIYVRHINNYKHMNCVWCVMSVACIWRCVYVVIMGWVGTLNQPEKKTLKSNSEGVSFWWIGTQNAMLFSQIYTPSDCLFL